MSPLASTHSFAAHLVRWLQSLLLCALLLSLAACGGDGTPAPSEGSATVGAAGGQITGPDGVVVTLPAGALSADTTVRIARDSSGAPALPEGLTALGSVYAITPHIPYLGVPATISLPFDASRLDSNGPAPEVLVAQPGGEWESLGTAVVADGRITAPTLHFSWVVTVQRPAHLTDVTVTLSQAFPRYAPFGIIDPSWQVYMVDQPFSGSITMTIVPTAFDTGGVTNHWFCVSPLTLSIIKTTYHPDGSISRSQTDLGSYTSPTTVTMPFSIDASDSGSTGFELQESCHLQSSAHGGIVGGIRTFGSVIGFIGNIAAAPGAPVITAQPQSLSVIAGQTASFTVAATATGTLTTEWFRSNDGGGTWTSTGATANPYAFTTAAGDNNAQFRAHVCDVSGTQQTCVDTSAATLTVSTVSAAPSFGTQPASLSVLAGQTASIVVSAGGTPPPRVRIYRGTAPNGTQVLECAAAGSGSNTPCSYTTPALALADSGTVFYAVADNTAGSVTSNSATVTVTDSVSGPSVITNPVDTTAAIGGIASFSVTATGTAPLSYQWYFNAVALSDRSAGGSTSGIAGAHSATLSLSNVQMADAGTYFVDVSNSNSTMSSQSAVLTVSATSASPSMTTPPTNQNTVVDGSATFTAQASGNPAPSYGWAAVHGASSATLPAAPGGTFSALGCDATVSYSADGSSLTLSHVTLGCDGMSVVVVASNGVGTTPASTATLFVSATPISTVGACFGDTSGWCYLQPAPTAESLAGVVIDTAAAKVYAVGVTDGFTMRSSDRGNAWDVAWDAGRYNFRDVAQPSSGVLVATGSFPVYPFAIFRSLDGGLSWTTVLSIPVGDYVEGVAFADANVGIAVGSQVWRTTDGGATWSVVSVPPATLPAGSGLIRPAYAGNNVFVAVADSGTFLRSTDRGLTWTRITTAGTDYLNGIAFGGSGFGVAIQQSQAGVLHTSDYGATWSVVPLDPAIDGATGVGFADANTVVVMGLHGAVTRSTDGGSTWTAADYSLAAGQQVWHVRFADASFGLAVGEYGAVARTFDGGATWTRVAGGRLDDSIQKIITSPDGAVTLASVISGQIKRSTDAGLTWADVSTPALIGSSMLSFSSANVVMGFSLFGSVAISSDAGGSWTNLVDDSTVNFNGGAMASTTTAIAYGRASSSSYGTGGFMRRTTDGGATWSAVALPTAKWLYPSRFLTATIGLVGGQDGTLLRTTDAGATWTAIDIHPANAGDAVRAIARLSDTIVLLATDGEIKRSTDAGLTWTTVYAHGMEELAFRDTSTGIAVGNSIATTSDTGLTWTAIDIPLPVVLFGAAWPSPTTPVIGGDGGALLRNQRSGALTASRAKTLAVRSVPTRGPLATAAIAATKRATATAASAANRKSASRAAKK